MDELVKSLSSGKEKQLKVVSIVGHGGVGKTTLAKRLYQKLGGQFECRAFIRVSLNPDIRRLLTSTFLQIQRQQPCVHWDAQELTDSIAKHLQNKRYFIIIDDIWAASMWDIISRAFPEGNCCSRIITTTQIEDVAFACCSYRSERIFKLRAFNDDQSRKLFFSRIFVSEYNCPQEFKEVSYGIIRKCGGLPLAIINVASLLACEPKLVMERWMHIQHSLCSISRTDPTSEGMKEVLNLIYNNLPHHLKTCLLYLNMYPEDYTIHKDDLVKQWIAEGFLSAEEQDTEGVAGAYFDELIGRGMIQPVDTNYNNEVLSCTVHHMVLDFIAYKSMEENFITILDNMQTIQGLPDKVRRLSIQFGSAKCAKIPAGFRMSQVRSLIFFGLFTCIPSNVDYRLLQVLILHIWPDHDKTSFDLSRVCELFRLRYLKIACNMTVKLPTRMRGLLYLETLEVDARVAAVPSDIVHLQSLLNLRLPSENDLPHGIGHMTSLRRLGYFNLSNNSRYNVENLGKLTNLQDLHLTCSTEPSDHLQVGNMELLGSILGKCINLKSLILDAGASSTSISCDISCEGLSSVSPPLALLQRLELLPRICVFSNIPKWIGELGKLCILKIAVRKLSRKDIGILEGLPALTALSLYVHTVPVERIVFDKPGFSVLKYLKFRCSVPWLKFEADAMPNLGNLRLDFNALGADQHGTAPISIEHLSGLKEITAKIGGAGADAESALTTAISNHPSNPIINVQSVDWIFYGDEDRSMVKQEREHWTLEEQDVSLEKDPLEYYGTQDEDSGEHETKQADIRISTLSESSSRLPVPDTEIYRQYVPARLRKHMGFTASGPMEVLQSVLWSIQYVTNLIREDRKLSGELKNGLDFIKRGLLQMIQGDIEKYEELQLQELAYDIEDFVYLLWEPGPFGGFILNALGTDPRPEQLGRITHFKDSIKSLLEKIRQQKSSESSQSGAGTKGDRAPPYYTPEVDLVGISEPKSELLELLTAADGWQPEQLRVISIVGPRGVGKTALARAVHDGPVVADEFDCVAWVVASECNQAEDLLNKIHQDVARAAGPGGTRSGNLHDILKYNRYVVFIDDLQPTIFWKDIENAFPRNDKGSRIIVTTSVHSVAKACSSRGDRYVYAMGGLDDVDSKKLFWTVVQKAPSPSLDEGSKSIFLKCGGLPLALISAANYLGTQRQNPSKALCERVGEALGDYLSGNEIAFGKIKRALVQCYDSLPDYGHQTCLLSLSIFPRGHQINSKSLIRRLLAEGLIDGDVRNCLEKLIDRSIIEPVQIHNNSKVVERCQVHSIMLEFTIHKAVSKNFVTLIHGNKPQHNTNSRTVRRLTVQSSTKEWCDAFVKGPAIENGLSAVRSLTIFNSELLDFKKCKLLRVLDLEACNGLDERVLDDICELLFLKYLSLRGSDVPKIPKIIGKLYNLETLDIRETPVEILPMEVIMLPNLVYLFGQFELPLPHKPGEKRKLQDFLSEKSKLHTLAGFVTNKTQDFETIILHARSLRKVKVWCNDTATPAPRSTPAPAWRFTDLESLSINSSGLSKAFLSSLKAPCAINSIKLRGKLKSLPDSTTLGELRNLTELHLLSTGLRSKDLSVLQSLPCLEYLKLAEDGNKSGEGSFVVQSGGFPSLQRLWFEIRKLPRVQVEQGAMTNLTSLQLICREFADVLGVTDDIVHLGSLNEVVLHPSVGDSDLEAWKRAANQHQNRPHVKKQPTA